MEHTTSDEHKHVMHDENMTPYQRFVSRVLWKIFELSTLEVVLTFLHLLLFAAVTFGIVHGSGGHG
jgi:hypothetical protein